MLSERNRKLTSLLTLLIVLGLVLAACGAPAPVAESPTSEAVSTAETSIVGAEVVTAVPETPQRQVVVALSADTQGLDPHTTASPIPIYIFNHMFDKLVERNNEDMAIVPDLAESWDILDQTTYVFHLRQGVKFHNGEDLTASDVKFSFDRMGSDDPLFASLFKYVDPLIESVEIVDDYSVEIKLKAPYGPFLRRMPSFYIVPEDYIKAVGNEEFARQPVGTGPYKFVEWVKDDHLSLIANEDYWRGAPEIKDLVFKPIPEDATRVAALLAGEADVIERVPVGDVARLEQDPNVTVLPHADNKIYFLIMNPHNEPFDNVLVRQAVSHAIDWDTLLQLYEGYGFRAPLPGLPNDFGYAENEKALMSNAYNYDLEKAKALLAEAGYPDGFKTTIQLADGIWPKAVDVIQVIAAQLAEVGIEAEIEVSERALYDDEVYDFGKTKGISIYVMGNPLFDPDQLMTVHFYSATQHGGYYNDLSLDDLIVRAKESVDDAERIELYRQAMQHILEAAPFIWGFGVQQIYATRSDIQWTPRSDSRIFMDEASWK